MKRILTNWWFVSGAIVLLIVLLLCWGLPYFVGMLRPWWVRLLCFVLVAGIWGALAFLRVRKAKRANDALAAELAQGANDNEARQLGERMSEALKTLRSAAGGKRRDYLYSRPWYMIIGPPGAGKTTALVNSGLRFPYSTDAFRGVGGTRNLDFLFADEAVLVDTAGRYTSQDSDASSDAKGWQGFLGLLRKHRPLQPINGVIVAIGADELIAGDRARIDLHATTVRRRLAELRQSLEVNAPVYVLVTKADLLSGFVEFYEDLDVEGRRAALGTTLPLSNARPDLDTLAGAFDGMARAVERRQASRLASEPDAPRRALILGFPSQVSQLRARLLRFLEGVFLTGDAPIGALRGFYLTSGVQQGTPLDRIVAGMADVYDQPRLAMPEVGGGRAYFLNRLLIDVMFPEAGLVQLDPAARKRQRLQLTTASAALAGVAVLTLIAWGVSYARNRAFQSNLLAKSTEAQKIVSDVGIDLSEVRDDDPGLDQSLDLLRALRNLPQGYAERQRGGPPLTMRFGLFQSGLSARAEEAYRDALRRVMLPRVLLQLEQSLKGNLANPLAVYEPLKLYLMLGGQHAVDKNAIRAWATGYWSSQAYPGPDSEAIRKELTEHLDALLSDPDLSISWRGHQAPIDGTLIASARTALGGLSMADRAYAILKQKGMNAGGDPWSATGELGSSDAAAFVNGEALRQAQIPFFFTRSGYEKSYQVGLATVQNDLKNDIWVFGNDAQTASMREQLGQVRGGVAALYARDYSAAWDAVIALMQPKDYYHDKEALAIATKSPSPIKQLLLAIRKNTSFAGGSRAAGGLIQQRIDSKLGSLTALKTGAPGVDAGAEIEAHFKQLNDYVGGGRLDAFLSALNAAATDVNTASNTGPLGGEQVQGQMQASISKVQMAGADAPPQLKSFVSAVAGGSASAGTDASSQALSQDYSQNILPACKEATQDRYPFVQTSSVDVTAGQLQTVFGMGGKFDHFQAQIQPLVDTTGPIWHWKDGDPVATKLDPGSPSSFAKAAAIRELAVEGLTLRISVEQMSGGVDTVRFNSGDANFTFSANESDTQQIRWSAQSGAPSAQLVLMRGTQILNRFSESGIWALFRLVDRAKRDNAGPTTLLATFGNSNASVVLRIGLPSEHSPFSRGGVWTFRCPLAL